MMGDLMLNIITEFRRGILFVRLKGILDDKTTYLMQDRVTSLVKQNGITNLVINLNDVKKIDLKGISELFINYCILNRNYGHSYICGVNSLINNTIKNSNILSYIPEVNDELNAMRVIKWNS